MSYVSMEQRKKQREINKEFLRELFKDINSDKKYSEKKYLQEFDNMIKKNNCNKKCNMQNNYSQEFFTNQYSSNNVHISDAVYSNYYGHRTPSLF